MHDVNPEGLPGGGIGRKVNGRKLGVEKYIREEEEEARL